MNRNGTKTHNLGPQAGELSATVLNAVAAGAPHVSEIVVTKALDDASTDLFQASARGSK
jgi:hypothetical protein